MDNSKKPSYLFATSVINEKIGTKKIEDAIFEIAKNTTQDSMHKAVVHVANSSGIWDDSMTRSEISRVRGLYQSLYWTHLRTSHTFPEDEVSSEAVTVFRKVLDAFDEFMENPENFCTLPIPDASN